MENQIKNNAGDFIVAFLWLYFGIAITILIMWEYGYNSGKAGPGFEYIGTIWVENKYSKFESYFYEILPGIIFSLYVSFFFIDNKSLVQKILITVSLMFLYFSSYILGIISFGLFNIFSGGVGALIIMQLVSVKINLVLALFVGALMGTIGFILAYILSEPTNTSKTGEFIIIACMPWQIIIGGWLLSTKLVKKKKLIIN